MKESPAMPGMLDEFDELRYLSLMRLLSLSYFRPGLAAAIPDASKQAGATQSCHGNTGRFRHRSGSVERDAEVVTSQQDAFTIDSAIMVAPLQYIVGRIGKGCIADTNRRHVSLVSRGAE